MGDITLRKALEDYKTVHMPYRNFAERTREEYINDLRGLLKFLEQAGIRYATEIGLPIIERYAAHLEQEGFASLTRKRKIVAIRSFLSFLYQESYIHNNVAKQIVLPFSENTNPFVLTQTECNKLRSACANNPRDRAIIELLLQTGITLSELIHLTLNDLQLGEREHGFMRTLGSRGKKERLIPLNTKASVALRNYLSMRQPSESDIIFLNRFGEALGERGVQKMLRKYIKRAEIGNASIRTLRHTFGVQHIAKGTSLETIRDVMGFKDARSTTLYVELAKRLISKELQVNAL